MLFEILSTIEITATAALVVATLSVAFATTARRRILLAAGLAAWFVVVVVLGAALEIGVPGLGAAVAVPVAAICFAFFTAPPIRAALFAIPLPALVAANAARVLGVTFILLYAAHRLPAPFAPSAGYGDIFVGLTALPIAWLAARYGARARGLVLAWNAIGIADLVAAVGFAATSAAGPLQIFIVSPDSSLMTTLPWILIPCFLVPSYLSLHIAIFYRLSRMRPAALASNDRPGPISLAPVLAATVNPAPGAHFANAFQALYRAVAHMSA